MADKKISELVSLAGKDVAATDFFPVVDVSVAETKSLTRDELRNAVNAIHFTATKALATTAAASLPDDTIIEVAADESLAGARTRYKVAAGALVFAVNLDQVRLDLAAESGAEIIGTVASGSGAFPWDMQSRLRSQSLNLLDYFSAAKRNDVLARTGIFDHSAEILAACNLAISQKKSLYAPAGLYMYAATRIAPTLTSGCSFYMYGEGAGKTVFKEKSGQNAINGRYDMMFYFVAPNATEVNSIVLRDMTIDKNGASNGTPPTLYEWEQAHMIGISTAATGKIKRVVISGVELFDKVGGGIVLMAGNFDYVLIEDCHGRGFAAPVGQRGDFEFQAVVKKLVARGCTGKYMQSEPDISMPPAGVYPSASVVDCDIETLEFTGFSGAATAQTIYLDRINSVERLTIRNGKLLARDSNFVVNSENAGYWSRLAEGSLVDGGIVTVKYISATNSVSPFYPRSETTGGGFYLDFKGVKFIPGYGASATTIGPAVKNGAAYTGAQPFRVRFFDCDFDPKFDQTIYAYAAGNYEFVRCKMAGTMASAPGAVQVGGYAALLGNVILDTCDFSAVTGTRKIFYNNNNALWSLTFRGHHKYSEFTATYLSASPETYTNFSGVFTSDTVPAAQGIKGMRIRIANPTVGLGEEYVCTVTSSTAATFRMSSQFGVSRGTTAQRPAPVAADVGLRYLDTTLDADGKPIWWTGTAWVDATGAVV
jgi:hypothetical protein